MIDFEKAQHAISIQASIFNCYGCHIFSAVIIGGCSARVSTGYRIHDGYYNDDHVWDDNEIAFYTRWEGETHRDHRDFCRRPPEEQKEYFTWRHDHDKH